MSCFSILFDLMNKYIIDSTECIVLVEARNLNFDLCVDWIGETYNFRER
jgi:hypothetical protein